MKYQSTQDAFNNFLSLINAASKMSEEVVISFPTLVKLHVLNAKVNEFNSFITKTFQYSKHITIYSNPNFAKEGHVFEDLFFNNTNLSRTHDVCSLVDGR